MRIIISTIVSILFIVSTALANPQAKASKLTLSGQIVGGNNYSVLLVLPSGANKAVKLGSNGKFSFKGLTKSNLKNASLQLVGSDGQYFGPVVLASKGTKAYSVLSGKAPKNQTKVALGKINLNSGFAKVKAKVDKTIYNSKSVTTADANGNPKGAGKMGLISTAPANFRALADADVGGDQDADGIPSLFDVDDDGDTVLDAVDPDSATTTAAEDTYSTLYLGISQTLNVNVAGVDTTDIDSVIGGENYFGLLFYQGIAPDSTADGAHVICGDSLTYCRPTSAGGGTAIYSGVSESSNELRGSVWTDMNANGSGYPNLEYISGRQALVAGVQPRVGTSQFRPGDVYRLEFTNDGAVISSKTLTLSPYFVTVPALKTYNAGAGEQTVDYASAPGTSSGNPIVLSGDGVLTATFWRPQRLTISGAETGDYRDMGHLHYGLLVGDTNREFTCGGYYTNLSGLTEGTYLGEGDSIYADTGAVLWPLTDSSDDAEPDAAQTLGLTINLKQCLARSGNPAGTYMLTLTAAGENLSGGANRAGQNFYVTIP